MSRLVQEPEAARRRRRRAAIPACRTAVERLAEFHPGALAIVALDGRIRYANTAFNVLHGYHGAELVGRPLADLSCEPVSGSDSFFRRQPLVLLRLHRRKEGGLLRLELRFDFPDGAQIDAPVFVAARNLDVGEGCNDLVWRNAVEASGDGVWSCNLRTGEKFRSAAWYAMLGMHPPEAGHASDDSWAARLHPEDRDAAISALNDCLAGQCEDYAAEYRLRNQQGDWQWIAARGKVLERENGVPLRIVGVHRDIDSLRRAERSSRDHRESLAVLLDHVPDALAVTTCEVDGVVVAVNQAYCDLSGRSAQELVGQRVSAVSAWADEVQQRTVRSLLLAGTPIDDLQCVFRDRHGAEIPTSLSARRISINGTHYLIISRRDVRRRTQIEQQLRESEERWRFAIEGHGDALWEWRIDEGMVFRSPRWLAMLGLPEDAALVSTLEHQQAFFSGDTPWIRDGFQRLRMGHSDELNGECRLRHQEGREIWVSFRCRVMAKSVAGLPSRIIGTVRDISRQKQRQQLIDAQLDRLSHADRLLALGEMATVIAHEINQPLGVLANYAGVLVRRTATQPDLRELAVRMENETLRAGQVVWRMRQFSRYRQLQRERLDLRDLVSSSLELARLDARAQGIHIKTRLPETPLWIEADRVLLEQVLLNLLRNALQAMQGQLQAAAVLSVRAWRESLAREVIVEVADRGHGLSGEQSDGDFFRPFVSNRPEGLGLGLAIAQSIVVRHGGRLWARPRPEGGAIFAFAIAAASEDRVIEDGSGTSPEGDGDGNWAGDGA